MKDDMKNIGATPRNVMGNRLSNLDSIVMGQLPKVSSITRYLTRHRGSASPQPNPDNCDFIIPEKYKDNILYDSGVHDPERMIAIGDRQLVSELDSETLYGDGTFDKVPNIFFQLYTWHVKVGNSYPPCIYVLLQRKDTQTYVKMLQILKSIVPSLNPQKVLVDFEKACMNAIHLEFPDTEIKGCYFHLCQSVIRKANSLGLKTLYQSSHDLKIKIKSLAALAFVPTTNVKYVFGILADTFPDDDDDLNQVLDYFFSTYIEGVGGRRPQFPIEMWNQYEAAIERSPKTTNCCEGFHNTLNSIFHCSHPSVWLLFDGLKRDISCHKLTYEKSKLGQAEEPKKKYQKMYAQLACVVEGYEEETDKLQYLKRVANMT